MTFHVGSLTLTRVQVQALLDAAVSETRQKDDTSSPTPDATPTHGAFPGNNAQYGIFSNADGSVPAKKPRKHPFWPTPITR